MTNSISLYLVQLFEKYKWWVRWEQIEMSYFFKIISANILILFESIYGSIICVPAYIDENFDALSSCLSIRAINPKFSK